VAEFVGEDGGDLLRAFGLLEKAAEEDDVAAGEREGVDHLVVEDGDGEGVGKVHAVGDAGGQPVERGAARGGVACGQPVEPGLVERGADLVERRVAQRLLAFGRQDLGQLVRHGGDEHEDDERDRGDGGHRPGGDAAPAPHRLALAERGRAGGDLAAEGGVGEVEAREGVGRGGEDERAGGRLVGDGAEVGEQPAKGRAFGRRDDERGGVERDGHAADDRAVAVEEVGEGGHMAAPRSSASAKPSASVNSSRGRWRRTERFSVPVTVSVSA
jgi:hypothetical protein